MVRLSLDRTAANRKGIISGPGLTAITTTTSQLKESIQSINEIDEIRSRESGNMLKSLLPEVRDFAKIESWRFDFNTRLLSCSGAFFHAMEAPPNYLPDFKAYLDLIVIDERKILPQAIRKILKTGLPYIIAYHLNRQDGLSIILQHGYCEKDLNGKIVALFGTIENVSDYKKAGEQLKNLEERYRALLLSAHSSNQAENKNHFKISHINDASTNLDIGDKIYSDNTVIYMVPGRNAGPDQSLQSNIKNQPGKKAVLVEKIKALIVQLIHSSEERLVINFSQYLSDQLNYDYKYLSSIFSEQHGGNIQQFVASEKIELVKKLIEAGELNLTEIAWKMHYSSVGHLSNQFKKTTGISPSQYKLMGK